MSPAPDWTARVRRGVERVDADTLRAARGLGAATLHEAGGRIGALPAAIKPVAPGMAVCGPALTVHSPPGDNLWLHRALDLAQPGAVLVVAVGGGFEYGYFGEIMATMALARRLGGLVIDGGVRDGALLAAIGWPVFARGLAIRGTGKDAGAIGWIDHPVRVGEVTVHAGDLIVGDGDGVVAIPRTRAAEVVAAGQRREDAEAAIVQRLRGGEATLDVYRLR